MDIPVRPAKVPTSFAYLCLAALDAYAFLVNWLLSPIVKVCSSILLDKVVQVKFVRCSVIPGNLGTELA
jgi:hypothetical protein